MGIKKESWFIATCDSCKYKFENENGRAVGFDTKTEARHVVRDNGWTTTHGKLMCPWCTENNRRNTWS